MPGKVYLVGAGPGDPGLLTVKGQAILRQADCVLYDYLANPALVALAPAAAERIYVGKKRAAHAVPQEDIEAILVERARRGLTVVRLKGGDPFIFGRGGEEVEALAAAGIPFEVVPGVTSPLGIAAYTGVPLTHREHTSVVTFVTGHGAEHVRWNQVGSSDTLVILMGLQALPEIAAAIIAGGRSPDTPAMAVRWGTLPQQEIVTGTLAELPARVERAGLKPPATIIIGEVVRLRDRLDWFTRLPLFGQRIAVTRAAPQAGTLADRLRALGAAALELPTIAIRPPDDFGPLDAAIARLAEYDWLIFTSANGVACFVDRLDRSTQDWRALRGKLVAIGPATRAALAALHLKVDLVPAEFVAESVVAAFAAHDLQGERILLPRALVARDVIPVELARRGAIVDVVPAYQTITPPELSSQLTAVLAQPLDWITVTSSSTVTNLVQAAGVERLQNVRFASIGPVTSATLRAHGLKPTVEATVYTIDGLLAALCQAAITP